MKKSFYVVSIFSLLAIILLSIFFSGYIAFFLIIWVLHFGRGICEFRNSSNEYDEENEYGEEYEKMDDKVEDEGVNLGLNSDEQKIADGAIELIAKLYFSKDYKEFIKACSYKELICLKEWFANTKNSDNNIFKSVESEDFENMLYLSSNLYYDKNGGSTEKYKEAIETYNKIKTTAKNLLQNNNLMLNPDNKDFESDYLKLLGRPFAFVILFVVNVYPQFFNQESKTVLNFYAIDIDLRGCWIEKCQEMEKNDPKVKTHTMIVPNKNMEIDTQCEQE